MQAVEHDRSNPRPFGLDPEKLRVCYERSGTRPKGMSRYEAFAYQIEAEIARERSESSMGLLPLSRAYHRLRRHAEALAGALTQGVEIIDRCTPFDVSPGREILEAYRREVRGED